MPGTLSYQWLIVPSTNYMNDQPDEMALNPQYFATQLYQLTAAGK